MKNRFDIRGDVTAIYINHKGAILEALIDTEDIPKVAAYPNTWCITIKKHTLYATHVEQSDHVRETVKMHRVIMDVSDESLQVDHRDHNGLNNRKENLRVCTNQENCQNRKLKKSRSGVRNVTKIREDRYRVILSVEGKKIHIGYYQTLEEAADQAKEARKIYMPFSVDDKEVSNENDL